MLSRHGSVAAHRVTNGAPPLSNQPQPPQSQQPPQSGSVVGAKTPRVLDEDEAMLAKMPPLPLSARGRPYRYLSF